MAHGGARNRSGPTADPNSARSEARGIKYLHLPSKGYTGRVPAWPLTKATARERAVWKDAWRTPQAAQWAKEKWRHRAVALWVRWTVRAEEPDAPAAALTQSLRLADQIGLSPAGLSENGWKIVGDELADARTAKQEKPTVEPAARSAPVRRLRSVSGGT